MRACGLARREHGGGRASLQCESISASGAAVSQPARTKAGGNGRGRQEEGIMQRRNAYIVSGIGAIVLFAAFLTYNAQPVPLWNWIKLSDILTIVGGLMFVIPFYTLSVHVKTREHAPNPWVWQLLPVVGMFLMVVGLLIPNDFVSLGSLALCDVLYFLGCVGMLMIFVYRCR